MERPTKKIAADESSSSGVNLAIAMRHLVGACLQGIGGRGSVSDIYNEFVDRFGVTKSDRLYTWVHNQLWRNDFVTVSERVKRGQKSPSNFYTLSESKFEAFLQKCGIYRSEERCLQIVNTSLTCSRYAIMVPTRKQVLEIPSNEFITTMSDCLENECGGTATLGPIVAAVATRLNLSAEESGRNSTIYHRVQWFLRRSGRFQSTGAGRTCVWTALGRPNSQKQKRSQLQKRVLEISSDELITTMIDCLEGECGGSSTLAPIVAAVAARLNLPAEKSGRNSSIYWRVKSFLHRSGRFQSTGTGCASTWTALERSKSQEPERSRLQKRALEIPSDELIATMIDCLESECGGSSTLAPIVAAVASRLNLPAENAGKNSTIYKRVRYYLRQDGRFQSTGAGRTCVWTALRRPSGQKQKRSQLQKRVLEISPNEFITTMIDCLENECGGTATLAPIVAAVAARINLPAEHSGRHNTIYDRVRKFLYNDGRFKSTGTSRTRTWTVLERSNSQEWSQPAVNAFLWRVRKREQKNAAAERQKCKRQREMAELERKVKELEKEPQQNASDGIEGLSDAEIKFNPETGCLTISMESGRIRQLVATSNSTRMAISTSNGLPAVGARILDNGAKFRPEWSGDRKQVRLSRQNDIDELLLGD